VGAIADFLAADHDRLDRLLAEATAEPGRIALEPFARFREGLLRHIGMEEKALFPAAKEARGGAPVPEFARLRADHGRLTALLVPTPTPELVADIRAVLAPHNALEEALGGVYEACETALGDDVGVFLAKLRETPVPPTRPFYDRRRPVILEAPDDERG
jgi:hypothetical protein